jgi:hypothetical protein
MSPGGMRPFSSSPPMRSSRNPGFMMGRMRGAAAMPGPAALPMVPTDSTAGLSPQLPQAPTVSVRQDRPVQLPGASSQVTAGRAQAPRITAYTYPTPGSSVKPFANYSAPPAINPQMNRFGRGGMSYDRYQGRFGTIGTQNPFNQTPKMSGGVGGVTTMPQQTRPLTRPATQGTIMMQGMADPQHFADHRPQALHPQERLVAAGEDSRVGPVNCLASSRWLAVQVELQCRTVVWGPARKVCQNHLDRPFGHLRQARTEASSIDCERGPRTCSSGAECSWPTKAVLPLCPVSPT